MTKKITALIIMDGFGIAPEGPSSAISTENTPVLTALKEKYPNSIYNLTIFSRHNVTN